jgi:hypothetical protein
MHNSLGSRIPTNFVVNVIHYGYDEAAAGLLEISRHGFWRVWWCAMAYSAVEGDWLSRSEGLLISS